MSLEPTAAIVYPDSTVPLVANLATVAIRRYVVLICIFFHSEVEEELAFYSTPWSQALSFVQVFLQFYLQKSKRHTVYFDLPQWVQVDSVANFWNFMQINE